MQKGATRQRATSYSQAQMLGADVPGVAASERASRVPGRREPSGEPSVQPQPRPPLGQSARCAPGALIAKPRQVCGSAPQAKLGQRQWGVVTLQGEQNRPGPRGVPSSGTWRVVNISSDLKGFFVDISQVGTFSVHFMLNTSSCCSRGPIHPILISI